MQETDRRTVPEIIIGLHDMARTMEQKTALSMRQEAFELRRIADRLSMLENNEREERLRHSRPLRQEKKVLQGAEEDND